PGRARRSRGRRTAPDRARRAIGHTRCDLAGHAAGVGDVRRRQGAGRNDGVSALAGGDRLARGSLRALRERRRPSWLADAGRLRHRRDLRPVLDDAIFALAAILLADEVERVVQRGDGPLEVRLRLAPLDAQPVDLALDVLGLRL